MKKYNHKKIQVFSSLVLSLLSVFCLSQAPSPKFHDTKGNIEVNGAGQLQYTLPIALPPGVKSVAPQINLVYTSGANNGIAGYGWHLSGLTAIARIGKTVEKDGEAKGVQLDYSDYYSFNGQRLILKSGEYGKDGAEYVTEKYSNVKIKSVGQAHNILEPLNSPAYFEVTFEDGSQAWYGSWEGTPPFDYTARTPIEYNIVKWIDAQGNVINYNYQQENNVSVLSSISWGGNEFLNKANFNEISLTYTTRELAELSFVGGKDFIQKKILSEIKVISNGSQFKKYVVSYIKNGTNYQIVDKITEYNADNNPANPVSFTYPTPSQPVLEFSNNNVDSFENVKLTGDFNGDSYLDFIMNNGTIKLGGLNDTFTDVSTGKTFNTEAKVVHALLDEEGQVHNGNGIVQYEGGKVVGYIFRTNAFIKVFEKVVYVDPSCTYQGGGEGCRIILGSFNEGDINGDGISDVFISIKKQICQFVPVPGCNDFSKTLPSDNTINRPPPCHELKCDTHLVENYIVDLKNPNNPLSTYTVDSGINENSYYKQQYLDIDGDGKVNIIDVSNTAYTVFEFVKTSPTQYLKKIRFSGNLAETKAPEYPVLFGDFNGDGNIDFTIPTTDTKEKDNWRFYMGTEKGFSNTLKTDFLKFRKPDDYNNSSYPTYHIYRNFYTTSDINKDGKSDIVHINSFNKAGQVNSSGLILNRHYGYTIATYTANGVATNGSLDFFSSYNYGGYNYVTGTGEFSIFSPITSQVKVNNNYYDILLFWKERMHKLKSPSSVGKLSQIQSITQGGLVTSADYLEIIPNNTANPNFYQKVKKEYYPYFSLNRVDQSYAVSQLRQDGRKQDFRYRGMMGHLQGKGMMGYHQIARSSWYADGFENTKIWSGVETDPLFDGVPVKEWNIKTNNENNIFPADISENNTQLLTFKSTAYETNKLLNGQVITTPVSDSDKPKVVTANVVKSTKTKDFLSSTLTNSSITYGEYYLPKQSITSVNNDYAITTSNYGYIHNISGNGANYFVGRLQSKTNIVQAYGDIKSGKEEYTYENNLLKTLKIWNRDNSGYLLETYGYDGFGNITQKTVTNSVDSQTHTEKSLYDPKGRFVEKKTDNLGLETNIEYNNWGQIKKQTDPLGNTLINTYDSWGKLMLTENSLQGKTIYTYERDANDNVTITRNDPDDNISKTFTNKLGQVYKETTKAFGNGQFVSKETRYDILGRKTKESEPYFEGEGVSKWNIISYDDSVFPTKVTATAFTGKQTETTVSGLTTSVKESNTSDYGRTTTKTADPLGKIIASTDKGGTIKFFYNAAGEQIKAQYGENIVTTKYDAWDRKSEFNDPSNGLYKYEYDGLGKPKKIISPKGTKEYTYNNLGQLFSQKELSTADGGVATNKDISFTYDSKGMITKKSGTANGIPYSTEYEYDPQGRVVSVIEKNNGRTYANKGIIYDDKGREISYLKQLSSSGMITEVHIENVYNDWNGELYQIKDQLQDKVLWQLMETNAKGQILEARLGSAGISNSYNDATGMLTEIKHLSSLQQPILNIQYGFNAIRNELKSRKTLGDFNIIESFEYDDNNRLLKWTNPVTGQLSDNTYDEKGRIRQNDQVGEIKFDNSTKIYQPTGMSLNNNGTQNYNGDLIQTIVYNENNDPIQINGEKSRISFEYGLGSMRQRVDISSLTQNGTQSPIWEDTYTKFYSEDGSFEVVKNLFTAQEKHILYIGGNPYESDIVYLKNFEQSSGSYKFLHKDYLGSILAISDQDGKRLEQRHYDAWGNLTHLKIGDAAIITDKSLIANTSLLIDRGYTGHEHFMGVGIIHMNGRLYDPLLRRFLNADEHIQDPNNTQNYNKYGYVLNNPLMYNDPSGEFLPFLAIPIVKAIFIAAVSYTATLLITGSKFNILNLYSTIVMSLISAGITTVIGDVFSTTATTVGNEALRSLVHATAQGTLSFMQGDNFFTAAASAFLSSFASFGYTKAIGEVANSGVGQVAFSMFSGGVGHALAGGNFWEGVKIGAIVSIFNHLAHRGDNLFKASKSDGDGDSSIMKIMKANSPVGIFGTDPESIMINKVGINYVAGVNNINDTFYFLDNTGVGKASFRTVRTLYMSVTIKHAGIPTNAQRIFAKAIDAGLDALSLKVKLQEGIFTQQEMDLLLKNTIDLNLRFEKGTSSFQAPFNTMRKFMHSNWRGSWF